MCKINTHCSPADPEMLVLVPVLHDEIHYIVEDRMIFTPSLAVM
jgi:hypothetical protein